MMQRKLRIGTRPSMLAVRQAEIVAGLLLKQAPELEIEISTISTKGDKLLDVPLSKLGDKGVFVKEIEQALLENRIDLAVHSLKDLPYIMPEGLIIGAILKRDNPADVFISAKYKSIDELPLGAKIGTSSLRRIALLKNRRADLNIFPMRGNIDTRLRKLVEQELDGIILAAAGLIRLGWQDRITEYLEPDTFVPAPGQGALAVQTREDDTFTRQLLADIEHNETKFAVEAERSLMTALDGGCQVPIGAYARVEDGKLMLDAVVATPDGGKMLRASAVDGQSTSIELGKRVAALLLAQGAEDVITQARKGDS